MLIVHANFTEPNGISNSGIDFDACTSGRIKVYDQLLVSILFMIMLIVHTHCTENNSISNSAVALNVVKKKKNL